LDTSTTGEDVCPGWVEEEDVGAAFYEIVEGDAVLVIWKKTVQERKRERGKDIVFVEMIQPVLLSFCFVVDNGQIQEHKLHMHRNSPNAK